MGCLPTKSQIKKEVFTIIVVLALIFTLVTSLVTFAVMLRSFQNYLFPDPGIECWLIDPHSCFDRGPFYDDK
jgi:uncharacterized membrane protein